ARLARGQDAGEVGNCPRPLRMQFEEWAERVKCLRDTLRIVAAGNREKQLRGLQPFPQSCDRTRGGRADRRRIELRDVDPEREHIDLHRSLARDDGADPVVEAEVAQEASEEGTGVVVCVEADQVSTEHALEDFLVPREETEHIVRREWDMEEKSDPGLGQPFTNHPGKEEEMIVMDAELIVRAESPRH